MMMVCMWCLGTPLLLLVLHFEAVCVWNYEKVAEFLNEFFLGKLRR